MAQQRTEMELLQYLMSQVYIANTGCWMWQGPLSNGYARFKHRQVTYPVHRYLWEYVNGLVPENLELDHLCRVPACVNPEHLEAVTHRENLMRGVRGNSFNTSKTHCPSGHEYTEENTYIPPGKAERQCKQCRKELQVVNYHLSGGAAKKREQRARVKLAKRSA